MRCPSGVSCVLLSRGARKRAHRLSPSDRLGLKDKQQQAELEGPEKRGRRRRSSHVDGKVCLVCYPLSLGLTSLNNSGAKVACAPVVGRRSIYLSIGFFFLSFFLPFSRWNISGLLLLCLFECLFIVSLLLSFFLEMRRVRC